jgi:hypothetical protein
MKEILLTQGKVALVDDDDFIKVSSGTWCAQRAKTTFYAHGHIPHRKKIISMHRFIMGDPEGKEIDHINGNGLDNRKENLRIVSHQENMINIHINCDSDKELLRRYISIRDRVIRLQNTHRNLYLALIKNGHTPSELLAVKEEPKKEPGVVSFPEPFYFMQHMGKVLKIPLNPGQKYPTKDQIEETANMSDGGISLTEEES